MTYVRQSNDLKSPSAIVTPEATSNAASASCADPFEAASIDRFVQPYYPPAAREQSATGSVHIKITLDATGAVRGTSVLQSSGSPQLDGAALYAAKRTTYHPTRFLCENEGGSYVYEADYSCSN